MGGDEINLTAMEPGVFGVQVREGDVTTSHRIRVSSDFIDLVSPGTEASDSSEIGEALVYETVKFLLERETATEIATSFSLHDVASTFPEYSQEIILRMSAG